MRKTSINLRLPTAGVLALVGLLLGACTTAPVPIPIPVPVTAPASGTEATAEPAAAEAPAEAANEVTLEGVTWQVSEARGADGTLAPASVMATMTLEEGQVSGNGGCNNFFGGYTLDGNQLAFEQLGSTMMACEEDAMAFEQAFLANVGEVASYAIAGEQLHLFDAGGTLLISAAPALAADPAETNPDPVDAAVRAAPVDLDTAEPEQARGRVVAPLGVNVRLGPGTDYPILGVATVGTEGEIVGKSEDGEWWVASVPSAPNEQGWVSAAYVEATNADSVPVIQAPALPEQTAAIQAGAAYQVEPGTILYSASRIVQDGNRVYELDDIYAVPASAGAQAEMVANNASQPALSPDRQTLAFHSLQSDKLGLGGYDVDSGRRLRFSAFIEDSQPRWSPTGDRLVFASDRQGDRRWRIYTTPATDKERPADMVYNELTLGKDPDWHPSQDRIIFKGCDDQGQNCGLYLIDADGGNRAGFTNEESDSLPRWFPDGNAVVFMSEGRDGNWDLYKASLADGAVTRLTDDPAPDGLPAVSPDGQQIAFISKRSGAWGLWVMPANGGAATQITAVPGDLPDWLLQAVDWAR